MIQRFFNLSLSVTVTKSTYHGQRILDNMFGHGSLINAMSSAFLGVRNVATLLWLNNSGLLIAFDKLVRRLVAINKRDYVYALLVLLFILWYRLDLEISLLIV